MNTARFVKYVRPFLNMVHERIKTKEFNQKIIHGHLTQRNLHILSKQEMYFDSLTPSVHKIVTYI